MGQAVETSSIIPLLDGRLAHVVFTDRHHGDLQIDGDPSLLTTRRDALAPYPWTWLRQVHGAEVAMVTEPGEGAGMEADGAVVSISSAVISVHTADCAPVVLIDEQGAIGVAHAGWRGLQAGVLEQAISGLRQLGNGPITALLGPCIHAECYEFSPSELDLLATRFGSEIRSMTREGTPALNVPAAVSAVLSSEGVSLDSSHSVCTGCDSRWFSHRRRQDVGRQAALAWISET